MPQFRYVARSAEGKRVDGVVEGTDRAAAIRLVEAQRFVPIKIEAVAGGNGNGAAGGKAEATQSTKRRAEAAGADGGSVVAERSDATPAAVQTLGYSHQYLFTEQLAHLLGSGMTLDEALGILVRRMKHPRLQGLSRGLHQALVDGRSLSQALRDYPRIFSPLYVNMVAAGEASGALADILKRLVAYLADVKALRDRVQQALVYPALLVVAGFGLVIVFMIVVVPKLTAFFAETGSRLPAATQVLLNVNHLLTHYWWLGILAAFGATAAWKAWTRSPAGRRTWDAWVWRLPLFSWVLRFRFYAQFARTLGTLADNGVTLLRALELLEEISGNEWVRLRMVEIRRAVVDGATLSTALTEQRLFPELFVDMLAVGEQTGRFGQTMNNIADVYERELDKQVKIISALVPPLVMLVIAAVVGFVVFGILSAVFSVTAGLRGGMR